MTASQKLQKASLRWFKLPERAASHPVISRYRDDLIRFKVAHAGRRSYKTELAKRTLVSEGMSNAGQNFFFGAPTHKQAKAIAWNDLKEFALPVTLERSETELWIKLLTGSTIHTVGFDKPERFEGRPWHGGVLDEYDDMKPSVWDENVRPALTDTRGWCWLIGVPGGKKHFYELSQYALHSGDPEWADYNWFTSDVLNPDEINRERERLDERTFKQEYEGSFESYEGRAYSYYDSDKHRKVQSFDSRLPVRISCDFNLDPCVWVLGQDRSGFISIQDEIKQRRTDIWKMCGELKRRLETRVGGECRKHHTIFYGDYEHGQSRSVSATASSWQIIRDEFRDWNVEFRYRGHPQIIDRVNAVNSKLRTAKGEIQLGLDPTCVESHSDFEVVSIEMLQSPTEKNKMPNRTHASDCIGYWINYDYPVRQTETKVY